MMVLVAVLLLSFRTRSVEAEAAGVVDRDGFRLASLPSLPLYDVDADDDADVDDGACEDILSVMQ